jgi:hypothetical protein
MIPVPPVQYLRDRLNLIEVTITGMELEDGRVAFGFAYRSPKDPPDKAVGGYLSIKRAIGMVHAAQNGVTAILSREDSTPRRGIVLKSFLGPKELLLDKLGRMNNPYQQTLPARVGRILIGIEKGKERKLRNELAKEE